MRVLVVTTCTDKKAVEHEKQLTLEDFRKGKEHVTQQERFLSHLMRPAREMYQGQQHIRLMRAIRECASTPPSTISVDLRIISAGYGLILGDRTIAPYEATFKGMRSNELRK